ncbi:MAG TPA: divergent polysaccharide deacetylase family protein, partial [Tabrizicola sp.]|nr:divergent polysaccharide deacetylase family protein [Tabrizicola sp.]
ETVTAEVAPATELPAPEAPPAEPADSEPDAPETAPTDSVPAEPAPAEPAATDVAPEAEPAEPEPAEVPAEEAPAAPAMDPAPEAPAPETAEADPTMPGTRPDALPGTLVEPQEPADAAEGKSSTFKPAPGLPRAGEGVIIDRGGETEPAPVDPAAPAVDPRPIAQFAAAFENPDAKPVFAIVLIDDGSPDLDREGLAALPFPVSFALDPLDPASAQHAATYRAAGREVVMMVTGIAEGAMPADVEVAFQSMEQGLPEAVAVMDLPDPAFQNRRPLAATVVPILKAQGRGLLTWDEGLNAADQVARREDLEAAVIFRDIGSSGEDAAAIRRLLDRAVFKAGQEGRVSVVGKADGATLAALLAWSIEGKAATVALAPVSAVLKVD